MEPCEPFENEACSAGRLLLMQCVDRMRADVIVDSVCPRDRRDSAAVGLYRRKNSCRKL